MPDRPKRQRYLMYIPDGAVHRGQSMSSIFWQGSAVGDNALDALDQKMSEVRRKVLPFVDHDIKILSVYVGTKDPTGRPGRIEPKKIDVATGQIKRTGQYLY